MRIDELIGYKQDQIYNKATELFHPDNIQHDQGYISSASAESDSESKYADPSNHLNTFMTFLEERGFHKLGMGAFGLVFEKPGYPWVFKIFNNDPAYLNYVRYCMASKSNPHVPRFKGGIIKINDDTFVVRIEKLKRLSYMLPDEDKLIGVLARWPNGPEDRKDWLAEKYPRIVEILNFIENNDEWKLDLDDNNVMMRGKTPIIVDPVWARLVH
jgi:hypothetical protein